jgi:hypothetical protein
LAGEFDQFKFVVHVRYYGEVSLDSQQFRPPERNRGF